ncbi:MAG: membrane protein insertase YidC [Candidatus Vogelbacteria bacterium]|nr:membrane protein insertase YidC [Candidatus Vogelbacteria bacterium]
MQFLFHNFFYRPLYNALVFLTAILPGHDLGMAVIVLTLFVKVLLIPVSHKTIKTQKKLKELEPQLAKIKEVHKNDQQEQAAKIMSLYKEHGVNPFSGVFLMFIQLPIILALFFVFKAGIDLTSADLYSFILRPQLISHLLFGLIDLTQKSFLLSVLVGLTQFVQVQLSLPPSPKKGGKDEDSFGDTLAQSMNFQVKFILPVFIMFVSYKLNTAVSVYWIVNNLFTIGHEFFVKKQAKKIISA